MSGKAVAVLLKPLIDLHGKPRNWATAADLYVEALADIPPDLLAKAVSLAIASNPFFPKPAELRASIADELVYHRQRLEAERQAALPPPPEAPRPSQADIDYVEGVVAEALRAIAARQDALGADLGPAE